MAAYSLSTKAAADLDGIYEYTISTALLLAAEGYRPITTGHFDGAAERLSQLERAPDVIICDYQLSAGPNGIETIQIVDLSARLTLLLQLRNDSPLQIAE